MSRPEVRRRFARLREWLSSWLQPRKNDPRRILIIGPGGCGKTTLANLLCAQATRNHPRGDYVESLAIEAHRLDDKRTEIIVPPGQHHRREATWGTLFREVAADHYRGIVLVNAFGYHSIGDFSYKDQKLFSTSKSRFLKRYLQTCLEDEINVARSLIKPIGSGQRPMWVLNLITKADLWWRRREAVEAHYASGPFGVVVAPLKTAALPRAVRLETAYICLIIRNFATNFNELLAKHSPDFDQATRQVLMERLLETLDTLRKWEEKMPSHTYPPKPSTRVMSAKVDALGALLMEYCNKLEKINLELTAASEQLEARSNPQAAVKRKIASIERRWNALCPAIDDLRRHVSQMIEHGAIEIGERVVLKVRLSELEGYCDSVHWLLGTIRPSLALLADGHPGGLGGSV